MALDSQIKNLALAIRQQESGGKYDTKGASGEYGAYQFMPATWNGLATKYLGTSVPLEQATPQQQNQVAYNYVKELAGKGYKPSQVAAAWNAGEDSLKDDQWKNNVGTNSLGVKYDTPSYVANVGNYYKQYSSATPTETTTTPPSPSIGAQVLGTDPNIDTYGATFPAKPDEGPVMSTLKAIGNVPSSAFNLAKGLASAVVHPVQTATSLFNLAYGAGEKIGRVLVDNTSIGDIKLPNGMTAKEHLASLSKDEQEQTFDALAHAMNERYGSLENAQRSATNDPVGVGADIFTILEGGAAALGKTEQLGNLVTKVASPIVTGGEKVSTLLPKLGSKILGQSTGVGSEAVNTAFNSAREGGEASKSFTEGLRGNTTPEDLVNKARGALDEIVDTRRSNYKEMLKALESDASIVDTTPLKTKLAKQLEDFNITKNADGTLNFDESTIVRPTDIKEIESMVKDVENWTKNTPDGIDTLKQRLSNYWEPGSRTGAFSEGLRSEARKLIEKVPGYSDAMKNYSDMSDTIKDIKQSLSLGDKAAVETSFTKLKNALKNDKEFRQAVIEELDAATNGTLRESIAGQGMSKLAPTGLPKYADIGAGILGLSHGVGIMPLLGMAVTTSPRVVGEIVNALGIGAKASKIVMSYLDKFAVPAVVGGATASK